ncbi:MAG: transglutaminase-like domain-containing protein, partial [Oscillospiraceae bacterium]
SAEVDYSNTAEGYVMAKYTGSNAKVKLQITGPNKVTYTYSLSKSRGWDAFPLTAGSGSYTLNIFENIGGSQYALALGTSFSAQLSSALLPYLYPNQYVGFTSQSTAVAKGEALAAAAATELEVVGNAYNYVIGNVRYDDDKAAKVADGRIAAPYLPSPDATLSEQKGICFDYAALMATMLRTQNIPTRMELGYVSGGIYHAWISVYITEIGWVNGMIQFDGAGWKLMDPTFASSGGSSAQIQQFIGNGSNYTTKFVY